MERPANTTPDDNPTSLIKRFLYLLGSLGVRESLLTVFFILLARKAPVVYGQFMLSLGIGATLLVFAEFGLNEFLVTRYRRHGRAAEAVVFQVLLLKSALWFVAAVGLLGFVHWQNYPAALIRIVIIYAAGAGLEALANSFFVILQVRSRQGLEGTIRGVAAAVAVSYAIVLLLLDAPSEWIAFFKVLESLLYLILLAAVGHWEKNAFSMQPTLAGMTTILPAIVVFGLLQFSAILFNKINLFYLQRFGGSPGVAQYSAAWQIVDGISVIVSGLFLQKVLFPVFMQMWSSRRKDAIRLARETGRWLLLAALLLVAVLTVESDHIILLIFGSQFSEAVAVQRLLAPTIVCAFLHNLAAFLMMTMGKERLLLMFYMAGLVCNVALCAFLIPADPVRGSAWSILLTKCLVAAMSLMYCQWQIRLIQTVPLTQLLFAMAVGGFLFYTTGPLTGRYPAECLLIMPLLLLAGVWLKQADGKLHFWKNEKGRI